MERDKLKKSKSRIEENLKMLSEDKQKYHSFQVELRQRLLACGWCDQIKLLCAETIKDRGTNFTVDELMKEVSLRAKILLPAEVKNELLQHIKAYLLKNKHYCNKNKEKAS